MPDALMPRSTRASAGFAWIKCHATRNTEFASDRDSSIGSHARRSSLERVELPSRATSRQQVKSIKVRICEEHATPSGFLALIGREPGYSGSKRYIQGKFRTL